MSSIIKSFTGRKRIRKSFGRIDAIVPMPNLIAVQRDSYESFLQMDVDPESRENTGLQEVFKSVFPIKDFAGKAELNFKSYYFEKPKFDVDECLQRGLTYAAQLKVIFSLTTWDIDDDTGARSKRDTKEHPVSMGDIPLMTDTGTFVINGTERVIVSQMHRSPGVFFDYDKSKTQISAERLYTARVIPYRGSWLDFEFDNKGKEIFARIDRKRKFPVTTLLYALESDETIAAKIKVKKEGGDLDKIEPKGMGREEILSNFYDTVTYKKEGDEWARPFSIENYENGKELSSPIINAKTGEIVAEKGKKITKRLLRKIEKGIDIVKIDISDIIGSYFARDVIDESTGEILCEAGDKITNKVLDKLQEAGKDELQVLKIKQTSGSGGPGPWIVNTLERDKNKNRKDALEDIYRIMRPGEPPTVEAGEALLRESFFEPERYDLSSVGRVKINIRLNENIPDTERVLYKEDILNIVKVLCDLKDGIGQVDDIDNLGNRRVRSVGELMENQYRTGLVRIEKTIRERMGSVEITNAVPQDLINIKPALAIIKEFFGSSQLSQFMDQTNPLSEITHKRRLSALGPGGLTRERASFEVRDVHPTHYGRICPIETPEGPNIGLINSLATYAKVNKYGFIETPYRLVEDGKLESEAKYFSADAEDKLVVAQADARISDGQLMDDLIAVRERGDFRLVPPDQVSACDVSPQQLVSVAAALIPFLENDDANRALMGSNMQRQAVPLIKSDAPLVGTGMEAIVAHDSGATIIAKRGGIVDQLDGSRIVIRAIDEEKETTLGVDIYRLKKYVRSNHSTCLNQKPLVKIGDRISKGDIIADGAATELGELALGRNVLVAFMPWNGYNFEDSILISERIVREDVFTSIHIEEFEVSARDTKLGIEEITRDIPNASGDMLAKLDESGIISIGSEVNPGDILVGKTTPKGESPITPEEKLLRAIFGEKADDVKDSSLRLKGTSGTVVDVRVFTKRGVEKDERSRAIEAQEIARLVKDRDDELAIQERSFYNRLKEKLIGQTLLGDFHGNKAETEITADILNSIHRPLWKKIPISNLDVRTDIEHLVNDFDNAVSSIKKHFEDKRDKIERGDELQPGVMKSVKVFVATKRKLQPGDKMAGRHGNKGVVSRVVPEEDMPFLEDGTPMDIVLNPLGVPSRMNVGQILETHLGWACANIGKKINQALEAYKQADDADKSSKKVSLLNELKDVYGDDIFEKNISEYDEQELLELSSNLSKGVPIATPVFDGASIPNIEEMLRKAGVDASGQSQLIDGRTGEKFDRLTTVGYIYMLKLHHLVDDKMHARSIGPYSLVTQQPLGGKAQAGGQRFGEMEVWALEAYGAAYTLREMLTVKSDDVVGRVHAYDAIIHENEDIEPGIPESFNVLVKELKSLALDVKFENSDILEENSALDESND